MVTALTDDNDNLLSLRDVSLNVRGHAAPLLDGVSFSVSRGETLCVVGESGCGKSLTSLSIMGLLAPALSAGLRGSMEFDGQDIDLRDLASLKRLRGSRIGMIFQEPMSSLNPAYRIGDQIAEAWRQHNPGDGMDQALEMLRLVGIPAAERRLRDYPHQLSGGMRQRVMIAMALVNNPALLIADEPTTALDVTIQAQILRLIARLQTERHMGTILITHDLGVVAEVATRVAVMYAGRIVETGPVEAIFTDPQHPYTIGLMSSIPPLRGPRERLATVPGIVPSIETMPEGCRFSTRCPFARSECRQTPPLQELAMRHFAACHFAPLEHKLKGAA
ncbi:ABC transporter ATP-binding protein [Paracoccus fistulariae]|uniref:ABC transporter ATP-binding protein n=1 Tax=Paracoccus fistulariae TaxID=658446 RepID=A0ABY7SLW2_9RHOB|nr:ABC transporter ATP-binding protein [Paracoccus fistulariae]MDB6179751.1 ABC transporter ATP-binding protein [Paracoccus fistulariae]WCR07864.1 ABC transporter ATP-binding protein [Paracoccus fistulariae]